MGLADELQEDTEKIFKDVWTTRKGSVIPNPEDVKLGNDGVYLDATVLYADLVGSTTLVDAKDPRFAAEVYKAFLHCSAKVVKAHGGQIRSYDGDRIMAIYHGSTKNTSAVKTALKINHAVKNIVNPALKKQYPDSTYEVKHCVGVDTSQLMAARIGVRGANDLVWVGRAANYAAKLCSLRKDDYASWITSQVYDVMMDEVKTHNDKPMWENLTWNGITIYRSLWTWVI